MIVVSCAGCKRVAVPVEKSPGGSILCSVQKSSPWPWAFELLVSRKHAMRYGSLNAAPSALQRQQECECAIDSKAGYQHQKDFAC